MNTPEFKKHTDPILRIATQKDTNIILEMMSRFYQLDHYPFYPEIAASLVKAFISDQSQGRIWMIVLGNRPVGYIALTFSFSFEFMGKNAFIDELFIEAEYRNLGIGTNVIEFVVNESKTLGINALHLEVEKHNHAGLKLYSNFSFQKHDRYLMTKLI